MLNCKIGLNKADPEYLKVLNEFIDSGFSLGFIGGESNLAHYFIGRINDDYIFLDPHVTKKSISVFHESSIDSYISKK